MEVEDYINLWTGCGINSVEDYFKLRNDKDLRLKLYIDREKMNYRNFWKATDLHFSYDTVCNSSKSTIDKSFDPVSSLKDCNAKNYGLFHMMGLDGWLDCVKYNLDVRKIEPNLLEIGPGWGAMVENYVCKYPNMKYTGFDVVSRFENVVEVEGENGTLSKEQLEKYRGSFNMAVCFNVFQHLYKDQISEYIGQVHELLTPNSYSAFVAQFCYQAGDCKTTSHYGQVVELPTYEEIKEMLEGKFQIVNTAFMPNTFPVVCFLMDRIH